MYTYAYRKVQVFLNVPEFFWHVGTSMHALYRIIVSLISYFFYLQFFLVLNPQVVLIETLVGTPITIIPKLKPPF